MTTTQKANETAKEICREDNGQYGHGLDAICRCGYRKGLHDAARPWLLGDLSLIPEGAPDPKCEGFKKARTKKAK